MKCLQGASALEQRLQRAGGAVQVFVVWERVLKTDWLAPASNVLDRVRDRRVAQFWDPGRTVSKALGETSFETKVWDWVAVYGGGAEWGAKPLYAGRPVEDVADAFERALAEASRSGAGD